MPPARARLLIGCLLALTACGPASSPQKPPGSTSPVPSATAKTAHVMVVVMENQEFSSVIGNSAAPFINVLASRYGLATQAYGGSHPSLPNYLELLAGSSYGINSDCTDCDVEGDTLVDQLARKGIGWTAYMGGVPGPCFTGDSTGDGYAKKHDPFMYFPHLRDEPSACRNVVPLSQLSTDLADSGTSPFKWVTPTLCDSGHDLQCGLQGSDRWLSANIGMVIDSGWYRSGGVVIVTWDEGTTNQGCCKGAAGGHVATLVISAATHPGVRLDRPVSHAGTLRTVETLFELEFLKTAACPCSGDLLPLLGR